MCRHSFAHTQRLTLAVTAHPLIGLQCVATAEAPPALGNVEAQPVRDADGQPTAFPATPGVYAVYAPDGSLQYIGLSRKARCHAVHPT